MVKKCAFPASMCAHARGRLANQKLPDYTALQRPLEQFRAKTKRFRIHPIEMLLIWIVTAHLVALPWIFGGARLWVQGASLGLAVAGFIVALLPRQYTEADTGGEVFRLLTWPKLIRFPIFWCGLVLLGYVALQAWNPAWQYVLSRQSWTMAPRLHYNWLPTSVVAPFEEWNIWRSFMVYLGAWLVVCSIWIGFTRRRSIQMLLIALAANGFLLACFGIAQKLQGNGKMYWVWPTEGTFFATFIYKNHAAAYLNLTLGIVCGLAGWFYIRAQRRLDKSSPSGLFAFFAMSMAIAVTVSYARGATIMMLAYVLLTMAAFMINQMLRPAGERRPVILIAVVIIFAAFLRLSFHAVGAGNAMDRVQNVLEQRADIGWTSRATATKASLQMLGDNWKFGAGAGSFRYLFPAYQQRFPLIYMENGRRFVWQHAHNDIVEFPLEFGLVGMIPILFGAGWLVLALIRAFVWENALSASIVTAGLFTLASAWFDFPLHNAAVFLTWCTLWPCALQWAQFEELNIKG